MHLHYCMLFVHRGFDFISKTAVKDCGKLWPLALFKFLQDPHLPNRRALRPPKENPGKDIAEIITIRWFFNSHEPLNPKEVWCHYCYTKMTASGSSIGSVLVSCSWKWLLVYTCCASPTNCDQLIVWENSKNAGKSNISSRGQGRSRTGNWKSI